MDGIWLMHIIGYSSHCCLVIIVVHISPTRLLVLRLAVGMDTKTSSGLWSSTSIQYYVVNESPLSSEPHLKIIHQQQRHCYGSTSQGEFPLAANPSIVLHVLTECNLDPQDLARLEASFCVYGFRMAEWIANCQACLASFLQYILMIVMFT